MFSRAKFIVNNKLKQRHIAVEIKQMLSDNINILASKDMSILNNGIIKIENKDDMSTIIGNVEFTLDGLGIVPTDDFYLNTYTKDFRSEKNNLANYINSIKVDRLHNIKDKFISILDELIEAKSSEYIYFITLYSLFTDELAGIKDGPFNKQTGIEETKIWNTLYKFQEDGAKGIIEKVENYNGCILADSVVIDESHNFRNNETRKDKVTRYMRMMDEVIMHLKPMK